MSGDKPPLEAAETKDAAPPLKGAKGSTFETWKGRCELGAHLAAVIGLGVLIWQVRDAKNEAASARDEARTIRAAEWVTGIIETDQWARLVRTYDILLDPRLDSAKKLVYFDTSHTAQSDLVHTLARLELLSYMYNEDKIDKEAIRRGPSKALVDYFKAAQFWICYNRSQEQDSTMYLEFERLVSDLTEAMQHGSLSTCR